MSILTDFRQALEDNNYRNSSFTGEKLSYSNMELCHILSGGIGNKQNSITSKTIMKYYNCNKDIANLIRDMPLLNVLIGTRKDNQNYRKDLNYVDKKILKILASLLYPYKKDFASFRKNGHNSIAYFFDLVFSHEIIFSMDYYNKDVVDNDVINKAEILLYTNMLQKIHILFHREINLYS